MSDDEVIRMALQILEQRARYNPVVLGSPGAVREYLRLKLGALEREEFWTIWLDAQNKVIDLECAFVGTLTQTAVYPREIVKSALKHNAAGVILAHNHPSGVAEPSHADIALTQTLKDTLALVDVRVLDHFIVAGTATPLSFGERGLI